MSYASFWQRFAATWIDFFILLPLMFTQVWFESLSKTAAIILVIPITAVYCVYTIYSHGRFGRTIGKYAMRIRVVRMTGERIGWREAWLRSSMDVVFSVLHVVAALDALATIPDTEYYGVGWTQRAANLYALYPAWLRWTETASVIWVWSELVVMLFNKKRRALHDFIAGTVVTADDKNFRCTDTD